MFSIFSFLIFFFSYFVVVVVVVVAWCSSCAVNRHTISLFAPAELSLFLKEFFNKQIESSLHSIPMYWCASLLILKGIFLTLTVFIEFIQAIPTNAAANGQWTCIVYKCWVWDSIKQWCLLWNKIDEIVRNKRQRTFIFDSPVWCWYVPHGFLLLLLLLYGIRNMRYSS